MHLQQNIVDLIKPFCQVNQDFSLYEIEFGELNQIVEKLVIFD